MNSADLNRRKTGYRVISSRTTSEEWKYFWEILADKLMLEDLLAGEADPVGFLQEMVRETSIEAEEMLHKEFTDISIQRIRSRKE